MYVKFKKCTCVELTSPEQAEAWWKTIENVAFLFLKWAEVFFSTAGKTQAIDR